MHRVMSFLVNKSTKDGLEITTLVAGFIAVWCMLFGLGAAFNGGLVIGITLITLSVICLAAASLAHYVKHELLAYHQHRRDLRNHETDYNTRELMAEADIIYRAEPDYESDNYVFKYIGNVTYNGSRHMRKFERTVKRAADESGKFPNITKAERSVLNRRLLDEAKAVRVRILHDEPELGGPGRYEAFNKFLDTIH